MQVLQTTCNGGARLCHGENCRLHMCMHMHVATLRIYSRSSRQHARRGRRDETAHAAACLPGCGRRAVAATARFGLVRREVSELGLLPQMGRDERAIRVGRAEGRGVLPGGWRQAARVEYGRAAGPASWQPGNGLRLPREPRGAHGERQAGDRDRFRRHSRRRASLHAQRRRVCRAAGSCVPQTPTAGRARARARPGRCASAQAARRRADPPRAAALADTGQSVRHTRRPAAGRAAAGGHRVLRAADDRSEGACVVHR